jgi:hypothetical protein
MCPVSNVQALRHLVQAQGIAKVARAASIERESLSRALSVLGSPHDQPRATASAGKGGRFGTFLPAAFFAQ